MKKRLSLFLLLILFLDASAQSFPEVMEIAKRRVPWLASSLVIKKNGANSLSSSVVLQTINGKLHIEASDANAAAMGLGWYLKYYCHRSMSHLGDNLSAPKSLPIITKKVTVSSPFKYRYALNYCTVSYSMSNYTWTDWERELDWLALNGVNLVLAPVGMEAVWQNTLIKLGYTRGETLGFITHPAFNAWWLMGNLENWGGPVSQTVIDQQKRLQQKIIKRMSLLGMQPVMQGFYGIIPTSLKNKIKIDVIPQGRWAGDFIRPDFLNPSDSAFQKIAKIFYDEIKKLYGKDFKYFGGDPFHEGGSSNNTDITKAANIIQQEMNKAFPGSTWVLQGWGGNPSKQLLAGVNKKQTLIIDLFGESQHNWEKTNGFDNTPFIWCSVNNFGEKNGLYGKLQRFSDEINRASKSRYSSLLQGIGIIPEGIFNNPITYDWMLELGWHAEKADAKRWIKDYQLYRYGKSDSVMEKAWDLFLQTVYSSPDIHQEGASESIFCARPSTSIKSVSTWGTRKRNYNTSLFKEGVKLFVSLEDKYKNSETYQTDKIDFLRQALANEGDTVYDCIIAAIHKKDMAKFESQNRRFLDMILMQNDLTSRCPYFRLDYWLKKSENFGQNTTDKQQAYRNTKMQYTIWGPDNNPNTNLHDYAHKEWCGLLNTLYYNRWKLFFDTELAKLQGKPVSEVNYFEMEKEWINQRHTTDKPMVPNKTYERIVKEILE